MYTDIHFQEGVISVACGVTDSTNGGESASTCGGFSAEVKALTK